MLVISRSPGDSEPFTCVMLLSVSLEQAVRSSSCSLLRAKSEAPADRFSCCSSSCVTGFGWSSMLGGLKKPMLPKVRVNVGPFSSCEEKRLLNDKVTEKFRVQTHKLDTSVALTNFLLRTHFSTVPSNPLSLISLHQPRRRITSFSR